MSYAALLLLVGLASWGIANLALSLLVAAAWRPAARVIRSIEPRTRADVLFFLRVLPFAGASVVASGLVAPAFYKLEPPGANEVPGWILNVAAASALALIVLGIARLWRDATATRRLRQTCERAATPLALAGWKGEARCVECRFPLVAVMGILRPRLFVARCVLDACSPNELRSILAHEACHAARFDNLRRLVLGASPDVLALTKTGAAIAALWNAAVEEAADGDAARVGATGRLDLASALVRVARLAAGRMPGVLPASALFDGSEVARRVDRLLQDCPAERSAHRLMRALLVGAALGICFMILFQPAAPAVHELTEFAVARLP